MRTAHCIPLTLDQLKKVEELYPQFHALVELVEQFPETCSATLRIEWEPTAREVEE